MANFKLLMQSLIADLAPPIVLRPAQRLWHRARGLGSHTFEGCYPTLAAVPCGECRYDDDELAEQIVSAGLKNLSSSRATSKAGDDDGRLILPLIVSQLCEEPLTVLDFGGGVGVGFRCIKNYVPDLDPSKFSYVLVETAAMCRALRGKIEEPFIEIADDIPASLGANLIVSMSSAIQYVPDYRATLRRLADLKPHCFIVSLTPFTDDPTYARQQLNIPHKRIATWVFNRSDFISGMAELSYRLAFTVDHDLPITHKNAPGPSSIASMVFRSEVPEKSK
jgi:putative methyltransferase (TIGR04325 family)